MVNLNHLVYFLTATAALLRLVPHPFNITPIGALGLFSGAHLNSRWRYAFPLVALLIGDFVLGFYDGFVMTAVYVGFLLTTVIGRGLLSQQRSPRRYVTAVITGALAFYLVSNIGMWYSYWPRTSAGLLACYIEGLPFLARTLIGDAIYAGLLFGGFEWLQRKRPEPRCAIV